ncbi:MAG TPA: shikimate dehydrogenase [Stellaceae bacterium]|nr:shikimate dehydrogenase [Stellaceae bacterium]
MPISGAARIAGIMGWPIAHSRSPALHGFWLAEHGIDGAYVPLAVPPERLEQALRALPALGFRGCNLTIPHKQAALAAMDRVDPLARRIGAMNTVVVAADGALEGSNTDIFGFRENLREQAPAWDAAAGPAVVLGAGGSARAVVAALGEAGVREVRLVNRTLGRAQALARELATPGTRISVHPWSARAELLAGAGLLVNTTSLGMERAPALEIDLAALPDDAVVADLVYVPLETGLLRAARRRGLPAVDGLGMLLHQGRPGFAAWFGSEPQVTPALRAALLATFDPPRP